MRDRVRTRGRKRRLRRRGCNRQSTFAASRRTDLSDRSKFEPRFQLSGGRVNVRPLVETYSVMIAPGSQRNPRWRCFRSGSLDPQDAYAITSGSSDRTLADSSSTTRSRGSARAAARSQLLPGVLSLAFRSITNLPRFRASKRTVDDALHVLEIVAGQPGHQINRKVRMTKHRAHLAEQRIRDARGQRVRLAAQIGIEQREFGIHRGLFGELPAAALDAQGQLRK